MGLHLGEQPLAVLGVGEVADDHRHRLWQGCPLELLLAAAVGDHAATRCPRELPLRARPSPVDPPVTNATRTVVLVVMTPWFKFK